MPEVTVAEDVTLAYEESGDPDQQALLLLHGISMSRRYFHRQLESLGERARVIALDLRGHGGSSKVESGHTIPQYARDVERFIAALSLEQPVLLGWSMGAFVAWDYLRQSGTGAVGGLIVCDEAASDFKWPDFPHGFIDLPTLHALMSDVQTDQRAFLEHLVPEMFHHEQDPRDVEWMVAECMRLPLGGLAAILFDQSVQDYRESVKAIDIPTLICWGRHDALLPVSGAYDLLERIPRSELVLFEESGHCPFLEEAEKFNATVGEFVTQLAERRAPA
jgi:non-heme chloroperoxidase